MVNTGTAAQKKKREREVGMEREKGTYGLYSSGSLPALSVSVPPPPVSFPFSMFISFTSLLA